MPKVRKDRKSVKKRKYASRTRDDEEDDCAAILAARRARARMRASRMPSSSMNASRRGGAVAGGRGTGNRNLYEPLDYIRRVAQDTQREQNRGRFPGAPPPPPPVPPVPPPVPPVPPPVPPAPVLPPLPPRPRVPMFPRPQVGNAIDPEYNFVFAPVPPPVAPLQQFPAFPAHYEAFARQAMAREARPAAQQRRQANAPAIPGPVGDAIDPPGGIVPFVQNQEVARAPPELDVYAGMQLPGNFGRFFRGNMPYVNMFPEFPMRGPPRPPEQQLMIEAEVPRAAAPRGGDLVDDVARDNPLLRGFNEYVAEQERLNSEDSARIQARARYVVAERQRSIDEFARAEAARIAQRQVDEEARERNINRVITQINERLGPAARQQADPLGIGFGMEQLISGQANLDRLVSEEQGVGLGMGAFVADDQRTAEYVDAQRRRERREQRESETPEERQQRKTAAKETRKAEKDAAKAASIAMIEAQIREKQRQQDLILDPNSPEKSTDKRRGTATPSFQVDRQVSGAVLASTNVTRRRRPSRWDAPGAGAGAGAGAGRDQSYFDDQSSPSTSPGNLGRVSTPLSGFRGSLVDVSMSPSTSISGDLDTSVDSQRSNRSSRSSNVPRPTISPPEELQEVITDLEIGN